MSGPIYEVRSPRSVVPDTARVPLAPRPAALDGARIVVVRTMPPGSGVETVAEAIEQRLRAAHPGAVVEGYLRRQFLDDDPQERAELVERADAAIVVTGPAATMVHVNLKIASELERAGLPTAATVFGSLERTAEHVCEMLAAPLRWVAVPNPPEDDVALAEAARAVIDGLIRPLEAGERRTGIRAAAPEPHIAFTGDLRAIDDEFLRRGWSDGLPIVPPTPDAVEEMLTGTTLPRERIVTPTFRPEGIPVTVEEVAINAVLAGARPVHLPVILAAASILGDQAFESQTRSINSFAWAQLVSGPIATAAGFNGGLGALSPGTRANAAVGRALHLMYRTAKPRGRRPCRPGSAHGRAAAF